MKKIQKKTQKNISLNNYLGRLPNKNKYSLVKSKLNKSKTKHKKTKKQLNKRKKAGDAKTIVAKQGLNFVKNVGKDTAKTYIENQTKNLLKNTVNSLETKQYGNEFQSNNSNKEFKPASSYINNYNNANANIPKYNIPSYNSPSYKNNDINYNKNDYNQIVKNELKNINYENDYENENS